VKGAAPAASFRSTPPLHHTLDVDDAWDLGPSGIASPPRYSVVVAGRSSDRGSRTFSGRIQMKLRFGLLVAAIVAAPFAGRAQGTVERDLSFQRTRAATITATVKKVDLKTRMVTVVGESGKPFTFEASEEVKNLPQLKAETS
jgi:hypothetical protein